MRKPTLQQIEDEKEAMRVFRQTLTPRAQRLITAHLTRPKYEPPRRRVIGIQDMLTGDVVHLATYSDINAVAKREKDREDGARKQSLAYLVYNPDEGTFLAVQAGAGVEYHKITTDPHPWGPVENDKSVVQTDQFHYHRERTEPKRRITA